MRLTPLVLIDGVNLPAMSSIFVPISIDIVTSPKQSAPGRKLAVAHSGSAARGMTLMGVAADCPGGQLSWTIDCGGLKGYSVTISFLSRGCPGNGYGNGGGGSGTAPRRPRIVWISLPCVCPRRWRYLDARWHVLQERLRPLLRSAQGHL